MNELYAADPAVCSQFTELKLLLASFGPYAGRYLANYPVDWVARVERKFENSGVIENARVKTLLRRARENLTLVTRSNIAWVESQTWLANASPLLKERGDVFDGLIADTAYPPLIYQLQDLDLSPTSDERISGTAQEYARTAKILLLLSPEIAIVDPYLNPLKRSCAVVLASFFDLVAKGKCQKVILWARASEVFGTSNSDATQLDLKDALRKLVANAGFKNGQGVELILVEDESRHTKMHGRYLLSIKGGIRLDQGFQQLPAGRKVEVGPIGKSVHDGLLDIFFDNQHDMTVKFRLNQIAAKF